MKVLPFILIAFILAGCGGGATIVSKSLPCHPPAETMTKAEPLGPIGAENLKMTEIIQGWVQDNQRYNILMNKDNTLIDWVNTHCQK